MISLLQKDYYFVLGIKPDANEDAIKQRYRYLTRKYHPDSAATPEERAEKEKKMQELIEIYNTLKDPQKRKEYDEQYKFIKERKYFYKKKEKDSLITRLKNFLNKKKEEQKIINSNKYFKEAINTLNTTKDLDTAFLLFNKAIREDNHFIEALYNMALILYKKGQYKESINFLNKCLKIDEHFHLAKDMIKKITW